MLKVGRSAGDWILRSAMRMEQRSTELYGPENFRQLAGVRLLTTPSRVQAGFVMQNQLQAAMTAEPKNQTRNASPDGGNEKWGAVRKQGTDTSSCIPLDRRQRPIPSLQGFLLEVLNAHVGYRSSFRVSRLYGGQSLVRIGSRTA